jgi:hydroxymethylpyrimidine pyrophosphatase-like HAD family hydrolase
MNDPYFSTSECVNRLFNEYKKHEKLIIAVDFDDTLFDFHKKGFTYGKVINLLKECQNLGFYIVIFTGNENELLIREYCKSLGIEISSINENPIKLPYGNGRKIYYNILLDDRAGLGQAVEILEMLISKIELKKFYEEAQKS